MTDNSSRTSLRCRWSTLGDFARNALRGSSSVGPACSPLKLATKHLRTLFLFTYADYKTVFVPISVFAAVSAPAHSTGSLLHGLCWIWWHILQCNVSNQFKSVEEDQINRPWRPIPSGRVTREEAALLRKVLFVWCIGISACYGWEISLVSLILTVTMYLYDELGLSRHWLGRTLCNVPGYATFEIGAMKIMGKSNALGSTAMLAIALSMLIKITTNQMEDFADVAGDKAIGRLTLPILYPRCAKIYSSVAIVAWSIYLGYVWETNPAIRTLLLLLGLYLAWRTLRTAGARDEYMTRRYYNGWLLFTHLLPVSALVSTLRSA